MLVKIIAGVGVTAGIVIGVHVREAAACSGCRPARLVPEDSASVPANLPHLTWRPSMGAGGTSTPSSLLLTRDDAPGEPVPFTTTADADTYALVPDAPLVAGQTYTVTDPTACNRFGSPEGKTWGFTVTAEAPLPTTLGTLRAGAQERVLTTLAANAACSSDVDVARVAVDIEYAAEALPWKDALYYETYVDGERWWPYGDLLDPNAPGGNWRGRGSDWVTSICRSNGFAVANVAEGTHTVEIRATLPGTTVALSAGTVEVTLACDESPEPECTGAACPAFPEESGGCDAGGSRAPLGAALALALAAILTRRRRRNARPST
jgi:hypothetical protein